MKKILFLITLMIAAATVHLCAASLSVENLTIQAGQNGQLAVSMTNTESNLSGFQFRLYLPEGLSIATNDKGKFQYTLGDRIENHSLTIKALDDGGYQFIAYSMDGDVITGTSGVLLSVPVVPAGNFVSGEGTVSDIRLTDLNANKTTCSNVSFTVTQVIPATGITLNKSTHSFNAAGQTVTLTATVTPANTTNKSVIWTSSNTNVATVSSTGVVTAVADGTATITATTADGTNLSATCEVTVAIPVLATGITLNKSTHSFNAAGQTVTLTATVTPANATNKSVTWTSSNTSVATVSSTGVVTAVADGTTTITATTADGTNLSATCEVTVAIPVPATGITLNKSAHSFNAAGQTVTLTATVTPENATNKNVTWTSSNTNVATVSSTGVVTAVADGAANITATTTDGTKLTATCMVTVDTSVIQFANSKVKTLCVDNWDTNGDGELNEAEAAAVTSLGTVFRNNKNITSFNELQYFTGLATIGDYAFDGCSGLTSIMIPEGVTGIGEGTLRGCSGLTSITLPSTLTSTGNESFRNCTGLTAVHISDLEAYCRISFGWYAPLFYAHKLYLNDEEVTGELVIPDGITSVSNVAFEGCTGITSLVIPEGVTSIGRGAFKSTNITSVSLPESLTSIGIEAFQDCSSLISVAIPDNVTSIQNSAFERCSNLTYVTIGNSVTSIGDYAFKGCYGLTSVTIGSGVASIGSQAFFGCNGLTSVTIPESVTSIGHNAFYGCSGLIRAEFANIESLCNISFGNNNANPLYFAHHLYIGEQEVTDVVIPEGVTSIGANAFYGCNNLTSVTLPSTLTSAGNYSFRNCTGLTAVHISDLEAYCRISFGWYNPLFYAHKLYLNDEEITGELVIPDGITSVSDVAFEACTGITSLVIPEGVTSIGQAAFKSTNITSVSLPESLTSIGNGAFQDCPSLTSVTIPSNVTSIGADSFSGSGLTSVNNLSETPQNIGSETFTNRANATLYVPSGTKSAYEAADYWKEFKEIIEPSPISFADANVKAICVANWDTNENGELNEDEAAAVTDLGEVFKNNTTITSFDELQYFTGLTTIGNNAFDGCSGLTSVILPNNVTCIANNAFSYCSSLTSISVPNSLTSIGNSSFWGCSALTSFTIPENVTSIGYSAFDNCSGLTSVTIPNSVTSIGRNAFSGCSSLTSISVATANTKYDNRNNCNAIIETESNVLIAGCKNTVIPENVTSIGESAFTGSGLTSITIPENVTSIARDAFSNCSGLTSITIPNSVTSIDFAVFWGCSNLTSVTIPNSVTSIDVLAFHGCSSLTSVISEIEEPFAFGEDAFSGISSECVLIVPAGKTNAYIAQGWTEDVFQGGIIEEAAAGNNLTLADAYGLAGAQCVLPISMSNTESIKILQFDLRLPEGVTVATNEYDEPMFTLTSRAHSSHTVSATHLSNGDYRVVVSSLSAKTFKDNEGVIMNVTLSVDKNLAAGDYEVKLLSIVLNTADNVPVKPSDVTATLTISDVAPGDANGDGEINVTDVGMVIDHILENTPSGFIADAADVNGDGEINVTDVGLIIDIILSDNYAREALIEDVEEIVEPE